MDNESCEICVRWRSTYQTPMYTYNRNLPAPPIYRIIRNRGASCSSIFHPDRCCWMGQAGFGLVIRKYDATVVVVLVQVERNHACTLAGCGRSRRYVIHPWIRNVFVFAVGGAGDDDVLPATESCIAFTIAVSYLKRYYRGLCPRIRLGLRSSHQLGNRGKLEVENAIITSGSLRGWNKGRKITFQVYQTANIGRGRSIDR